MENISYQPMNTEGQSDAIQPDAILTQQSKQRVQLLIPNDQIQSVNMQPIIIDGTMATQIIVISGNQERFACAGTCGRTFKHNDRTRTERAAGAKHIYCKPCKVKLLVTYEDLSYIAILACCFCSTLFGCVAIMYANRAHEAYQRGDIEEYRRQNRNAKICIVLAVIGGVISMFLLFLYKDLFFL
eukprot:408134_1